MVKSVELSVIITLFESITVDGVAVIKESIVVLLDSGVFVNATVAVATSDRGVYTVVGETVVKINAFNVIYLYMCHVRLDCIYHPHAGTYHVAITSYLPYKTLQLAEVWQDALQSHP